jgi:drug/metabolite transporter (DMT)-like permease
LRVRIALVYASCCALWGSTWLVVKIGLQDLGPLLFAGARMTLAGVLLAPLALRPGAPRLPASAWRLAAGVGLLQIAIPYGLNFAGQQWIPSSLAAVLFATFPVWIAVLAAALLPGEPLTPVRLLAAALGVTGVAVLQARALSGLSLSSRLALGSSLVVLSAAVAALANVLLRRSSTDLSPLQLTFAQTVISGPLLLLASGVFEAGRPVALSLRAAGAVGYLAVFGTCLTYLGLYWLLPRVSIAAIGAIPLFDTAIAVMLGATVLGEPLTWNLAAGCLLVLLAGALANGLLPPRRRASPG